MSFVFCYHLYLRLLELWSHLQQICFGKRPFLNAFDTQSVPLHRQNDSNTLSLSRLIIYVWNFTLINAEENTTEEVFL